MSLSEEERKERWRQYSKAYYIVNADKKKAYRIVNADEIKERQRKYYEVNPDKQKECQRKYYEANADKIKERQRKYYEANLDKVKKRSKKYQEAIADKMKNDITLWAKRRISEIKSKCVKKMVPFDLTVEYLISIYPKDGKCPIFETSFVVGDKTRVNNPSIDRIIPSKGYTKGNIRIISNRANILKRDATLEELIALGDDAKKHTDHPDSDSEEQPWL